MSVTSYNIDEIMALMGDTFDGLVAPRRIFRNNKNRIWLLFQGIAAGFRLINDMVVSLANKFDPANSSDDDLESIALLVGTEIKVGKSSFVQINVTNLDTVNPHSLLAGQYLYVSVTGQNFYMTLDADLAIAASATVMLIFASESKGAFSVGAISSVTISRTDLTAINPNFAYATLSNARYLGYADESPLDFRNRILNDTNRQDAIAELELAIRNLPEILECNLQFNATDADVVYDGITVPPFNLLLVITGFPATSMAEAVIAQTQYLTVEVDPLKKLTIANDHFLGGVFPVYYTNHAQKNFELHISYRFDGNKIVQLNAENAMIAALNARWKGASQYLATLTVGDPFELLYSLSLTSVQILQVDLTVGGSPVSYIDFLKTQLPNLNSITFTGTDIT